MEPRSSPPAYITRRISNKGGGERALSKLRISPISKFKGNVWIMQNIAWLSVHCKASHLLSLNFSGLCLARADISVSLRRSHSLDSFERSNEHSRISWESYPPTLLFSRCNVLYRVYTFNYGQWLIYKPLVIDTWYQFRSKELFYKLRDSVRKYMWVKLWALIINKYV